VRGLGALVLILPMVTLSATKSWSIDRMLCDEKYNYGLQDAPECIFSNEPIAPLSHRGLSTGDYWPLARLLRIAMVRRGFFTPQEGELYWLVAPSNHCDFGFMYSYPTDDIATNWDGSWKPDEKVAYQLRTSFRIVEEHLTESKSIAADGARPARFILSFEGTLGAYGANKEIEIYTHTEPGKFAYRLRSVGGRLPGDMLGARADGKTFTLVFDEALRGEVISLTKEIFAACSSH